MTRCKEFYEKLEKDGNFCGMSQEDFRESVKYWNEYRKDAEEDKTEKSVLSSGAWRKQKREQAARYHEVEPETSEEKEVKETKKLKARQYAVAAQINNAVIWCYDHGASEESIREVFEKALVSNRR